MNKNNPEISIVTAVLNEQDVVNEFYIRVKELLDETGLNYEIIVVDDGSRDNTLNILKSIHPESQGKLKVIQFARNFGHQLAITAGARYAKGDAVVIIDSDLQDPPEIILSFIEKWRQGYDVVYGVRSDRKGETWFKKWSAAVFYKVLSSVANVDIPNNVGDFYLLDRKVVDVLDTMSERHRFIRGLVAWMGFKRIGIDYVRKPRYAGKTKYSLFKMIKFSFDAFTSFSFAPLRIIFLCGIFISILAFLGILAVIIVKMFHPEVVLGWASIMVAVLFIGGIQLLGIGLIGEYLARIGDDVKNRPLYTIQSVWE